MHKYYLHICSAFWFKFNGCFLPEILVLTKASCLSKCDLIYKLLWLGIFRHYFTVAGTHFSGLQSCFFKIWNKKEHLHCTESIKFSWSQLFMSIKSEVMKSVGMKILLKISLLLTNTLHIIMTYVRLKK